jgi:hypothetical protein
MHPTAPILGKLVHDMMLVKGRTKAITVTSTPIEALTGAERMVDRKIVVVYNNSIVDVEYGFESTLVYGQGLIIPPGAEVELAIGHNVPIFLVGPPLSSLNVRVMEGY